MVFFKLLINFFLQLYNNKDLTWSCYKLKLKEHLLMQVINFSLFLGKTSVKCQPETCILDCHKASLHSINSIKYLLKCD